MENGLKINLNNQEKDLLLQDLSSRLPYGVILNCCNLVGEKNKMCMYELEMILGGNFIEDFKKAMEE